MQTSQLKIGLIGLGYIGKIHMFNCLHSQKVRLVAVADMSHQALKKAKEAGVSSLYTDYQELFKNQEVEAVIISLPTHLHSKCAIAAAEAKKHVLMEKPISRNTTEAREILSKVNANNVKLMIGYPLQFSTPFIELKNRIESGELGEILTAYTVNINSGPFMYRGEAGVPVAVPDWWWKKELIGGGALLDLGSHVLNVAQWYFGDVLEAKSYLGYRFNLEQEDNAISLFKFKGGQTVILNVGWYSGKTQLQFNVHGTCGQGVASLTAPSRIRTVAKLILRQSPPFYLPFLNEVEHFAECINNDQQPEPSGEDGYKDVHAIEMAYKNSSKM